MLLFLHQTARHNSLIEVIHQNSYIRSLGVREVYFDGIAMPKHNKDETLKLVKNYNELTEADKERIRKEVKKRMDDETEIIEKLKNLI